jgi:Glycosyl transferase family 2
MRGASADSLQCCLAAIARQDTEHPVEVVVVGMPVTGEALDIVPEPRAVACSSTDVWTLKTEGVRHATAPIVAFVDADCLPQESWANSILETFRFYPDVAVVLGQTREAGWLRWPFPARRREGPATTTAGSNIAFRREAYLDCPFQAGAGKKAAAIQAALLRRAHYQLWMQPAMQAIRDRRGLKQVEELRADYSTAVIR